jgi:mannose-1-phosphate guanylyltransferase/mannose-6-phosphate isomerase
MLVPVILSGGAGTRLWPLSRRRQPKQLLALAGDATMFQDTLRRVDGLDDVTLPIVIAAASQQAAIETQLRELGRAASSILLEPCGRNTAPAIAIAALDAQRTIGGDPLLLVLPADHAIADVAAFVAAVNLGRPRAEAGELVTFGITPRQPHTGYGYIRAAGAGVSAVAAFVEKPDLATAQAYVAAGDYYWNSGMFLFRCSRLLAELGAHAPDLIGPCTAALDGATVTETTTALDAAHFERCRSVSVDYAVMEKTAHATVVPLDAGWSDLGSWDALYDQAQAGVPGTVTRGDVLALDAEGCYLDARHGTLAVVGVRDLTVVVTEDAVLVVPRGAGQRVKEVVDALAARESSLLQSHPLQTSTWGSEHALDLVAPGVTRLSLHATADVQRSTGGAHARALTLQAGEVRVVTDAGETTLRPGDSLRLAAGVDYRVVNVTRRQAVLLEIDAT